MDEIKWIRLGFLDESNIDFSDYSSTIGLYKAILDDTIVYIGKATEVNNGGLRKRLRDYTRSSNSARNYFSGKKMYENSQKIIIEILIMNKENDIGEEEKKYIQKYNPIWNRINKGEFAKE